MTLKTGRFGVLRALHAEATGLGLLEESSVAAALLVSPEGRVLAANRRLVTLLRAGSADDLIGVPITDLLVERKSWNLWHQACLAGRERNVTLAFRCRDDAEVLLRGDLMPAPGDAAVRGSVAGVFADVTEEEKLRRAIQRSARMEALGSLTSGIAHDFNNLLTVLVGNLYLAAEDLREDAKAFVKLKAARDAAKRGADLIRQLLAFARREPLDTDVVDPGKIVEGLVPLLRRALGSKITLETKIQHDAGLARCNGAQLESVVVNLSVNARDAIESAGRIVVSVEGAELGAKTAAVQGLPEGEYVKLTVADDGVGIPAELLDRVFEPFFSTKTDSGGTGLGLSMVRWFAQQAGGKVIIDSAVGQGTRVTLLLPKSGDGTTETSTKTMPLSTLAGGDEAVLVFARDESLRAMIKQILEVLGYDVQLSEDASETIAALEAKPIDLLLVDGAAQAGPARQQLLRDALAARPNLKVIVTVDAADAARAKGSSATTSLLGKPFSLADLAGAVRRALDSSPGER